MQLPEYFLCPFCNGVGYVVVNGGGVAIEELRYDEQTCEHCYGEGLIRRNDQSGAMDKYAEELREHTEYMRRVDGGTKQRCNVEPTIAPDRG